MAIVKAIGLWLLKFTARTLIIFGLVVLVVRFTVFSPEPYINVLEKNNVYQVLQEYVEDEVTAQSGGVDILGLAGDSFQISEIIRPLIDNNIRNLMAYLTSENEEWFIYFPLDVLEARITTDTVKETTTNILYNQLSLLPDCDASQQRQIAEILANLDFFVEATRAGQGIPNCNPGESPQVRAAIEAQVDELITEQSLDGDIIETALAQSGFAGLQTNTPVTFFTQNDQFADLQSSLDTLEIVRYWIGAITNAAIILIVVGLILAFAYAFTQQDKVAGFLKFSSGVGMYLILDGLLLSALILAVQRFLIPNLDFTDAVAADYEMLTKSVVSDYLGVFLTPYVIILGIGVAVYVLFRVMLFVYTRQASLNTAVPGQVQTPPPS